MCRAIRKIRNGLAFAGSALGLGWVCLVLLLPTCPIRDRLQALLSERAGEPVRVESVRIGLLGQISVSGVTLGSAESPWLRLDTVSSPLDLYALVRGRLWPDQCRVEGLHIVAHRGADGSWKIGPEFAPRAVRGAGEAAAAGPARDAEGQRLEIEIAGGSLLVVDEPSDTQIELGRLAGLATWEPGVVHIERLRGELADGTVALAARLSTLDGMLGLDATLLASDVPVSQDLGALSYFVPMLTDRAGGLSGRLNLELAIRSQGECAADLTDALEGSARLALEDVRLEGSNLLEQVGDALNLSARARMGRAQGSFQIRDRRVGTQDLTVQLGGTPIRLAGWTDFAGRVDYAVHCEAIANRVSALAEQLPPEARRLARELNLTGEIDRLAELHLQGTRDHLRLEATGVSSTASAPGTGRRPRVDIDLERARKALRDLGTRPRDSLRR